jgi:flagellar biosynthetic protein FliR
VGDVTLDLPLATLLAVLLGSVRAAAWLAICPPFSSRGIPGPAKALLAIALALPMAPQVARTLSPTLPIERLLVAMALEVVTGATLGFCTYLVVVAIQSAGSLIDLFGGFSVAFAFDPLANTGNSVLGRFYNLLTITLLFATDAHQMIFSGFARSYRALPVTQTLSTPVLQQALTVGLGQMFLAALQIAGPLIAILFLADVALGLLSRVSPALNAFGLGFPAKILLTLILTASAMPLLPSVLARLVDSSVQLVLSLLEPP